MTPEMKEALAKLNEEKRAEAVAQGLADFVNPFGHDHKTFVETIVWKTHRTLQQSIGGLVFKLIKGWAKAYHDGMYDGRNELLCKTCAKIDSLMTEHDEVMQEDWDHLPCI